MSWILERTCNVASKDESSCILELQTSACKMYIKVFRPVDVEFLSFLPVGLCSIYCQHSCWNLSLAMCCQRYPKMGFQPSQTVGRPQVHVTRKGDHGILSIPLASSPLAPSSACAKTPCLQMARIAVANMGANRAQVSFGGAVEHLRIARDDHFKYSKLRYYRRQ